MDLILSKGILGGDAHDKSFELLRGFWLHVRLRLQDLVGYLLYRVHVEVLTATPVGASDGLGGLLNLIT